MTVVALAAVAALLLSVLGLSGVLRSVTRQHARERDLLIAQLLHAVGKPWHEAPAVTAADEIYREHRRALAELGEDGVRARFWASPEQRPVE